MNKPGDILLAIPSPRRETGKLATQTFSYKIKGFLDVLLGWLAFIALSPVLWLLAALIRLDSPGPIFFRPWRIGKDGRPFMVYKFRSMVDKAITKGLGVNYAINDPRITRVGRFLRASSLDELMQLYNILKGEMSLVGPRPTFPYQVLAYNDFQRRRLLVKPGITGWAQINGRNAIPWEERIRLDVWYMENWSLRLDLHIILKTVKTLITREGLHAPSGVSFDFGNYLDDEKAIARLSSK